MPAARANLSRMRAHLRPAWENTAVNGSRLVVGMLSGAAMLVLFFQALNFIQNHVI